MSLGTVNFAGMLGWVDGSQCGGGRWQSGGQFYLHSRSHLEARVWTDEIDPSNASSKGKEAAGGGT